jgi:hypothetical protein
VVSENEYNDAKNSLNSYLRRGIISQDEVNYEMGNNNTIQAINRVIAGLVVIASALGFFDLGGLLRLIPDLTQCILGILGVLGICAGFITLSYDFAKCLSGRNMYRYK